MGSGPIPQQMVLEREVQGFGGVAQLPRERLEAICYQPPHNPDAYLLSFFSELSRYREG